VVNAAAQGETIEDVMIFVPRSGLPRHGDLEDRRGRQARPGARRAIRHKLKVVGVANGQRVPEDWHRLSSQRLVQRALRAHANPSWKLDADEVSLVFAGLHVPRRAGRSRALRLSADARLRPRTNADSPFEAFRAAARPGRRPAPPVRRPRPRFVAVVANPQMAFSGLVLERLARACSAAAGSTLVVDASAAPEPHELVALDLAAGIEPFGSGLDYLAARGLPLRHVNSRGSCAGFLQAVVDAAPAADVVIVHAEASELGRLFTAARYARCCWPPTARPA
jgi:hypothetical protein